MQATSNNATVTVIGLHDVAITNVASSKTVVRQGFSTSLNVTVANQGDYTETFNVTAYYGNGTLTPEQWNEFWSMGDCNRDGYINEVDVEIMAANYGWSGPPGTNPADINSDGIVNLSDAIILAVNLQKEIWGTFLPAIGTQTIFNLTNGNSISLTLTWNTTGLTYGNYTITAVAKPVMNETNTSNNNCTGGSVIVAIPGDIAGGKNGLPDGIVDMKDIATVAAAFGSKPADSWWNANVDINNEGRVDMKDIAIAAAHFGQHYP